ncbi:MAG: DUF4129 domain-containing protein [Dehalococcoidia bacterium]|nr:DUF4129 domain-containing protein [Dehalococcoidia bacterium]
MMLDRASEILAGTPRSDEGGPDSPLMALVRRVTPSEGWLTYGVLLLSLLSVTWSVNDADWVETPSLAGIMALSTFTGMTLAKVRLRGPWLLLLASVFGGLFVYWQASTLAEAGSFLGRFQELNQRMAAWWSAATSGGISTDELPFGLILAGITWIVGFAAAWSVFRFRNVWGAMLPSAIGMLANLSYLPDRYLGYLFLYLFFTALLMVRLYSIERQRRWEKRQTEYPTSHGIIAMSDGVWFALLVFAIAALLPSRLGVSDAVRGVWSHTRAPVDQVEDDFGRLFSQLPSRKPASTLELAPLLPFSGPLNTSEEVVLSVQSAFPTYWRMRVYSTYGSRGWLNDKTERHDLPWVPDLAQPAENNSRLELTQSVEALFPLRQLALGSTLLEAGQPTEIEVLPAKKHLLRVREDEAGSNLPRDLRGSLNALRAQSSPMGRDQLAQTLLQSLPNSVVVTKLTLRDASSGNERRVTVKAESDEQYLTALRRALPREGAYQVSAVEVQRRNPYPADVVAVVSKSQIERGEAYTVVSLVSVASLAELNSANTAYPGWVLDRYLQVPESLPFRVRLLARQVTGNAVTPFEKAFAIEEYLRSTMTYDTQVAAPPPTADGVDHFLFESQRGYSDYFASAMVMMARTLDLPARLVGGYAPGSYDQEANRFVVRDKDSHTWPELYFPGYGWVEFEPTPGKGTIARGLPTPADAEVTPSSGVNVPFIPGMTVVTPFASSAQPIQEALASQQTISGSYWFISVLALGAALAAVCAALWLWYRRTFVQVPAAALVYERMARLGSWSGLAPAPGQTATEYAQSLSQHYPALQDEFTFVTSVYARSRYSTHDASPEESQRIFQAWPQIRRRLFRRLFRRR